LRSIEPENLSDEPLSLRVHCYVIFFKNQDSIQIGARVIAIDFKSESTRCRVKIDFVSSENSVNWLDWPENVNLNVKDTVFNNQPFFFHFMNSEQNSLFVKNLIRSVFKIESLKSYVVISKHHCFQSSQLYFSICSFLSFIDERD